MRPATVWTFYDLGYFLGAILPSAVLTGILTGWISDSSARSLAYQTVLYILLLSVLFVLGQIRHETGFLTAINWNIHFSGAWWCIILAPAIALLANALTVYWRAPLVPSAIDILSTGPVPMPLVGLFAVVFGPFFEEVVFRGFLQPLLQKWGIRRGLLLTAMAFSLMHGSQNEWAWQYVLLLFLVGTAFGLARHRTGSTVASFLLHMGYNLTQLIAALVVPLVLGN